jgi:hypothetical protein
LEITHREQMESVTYEQHVLVQHKQAKNKKIRRKRATVAPYSRRNRIFLQESSS